MATTKNVRAVLKYLQFHDLLYFMPLARIPPSVEHTYYESLRSTAASCLGDTAFVQCREFSDEDVLKTRSFLVVAAGHANPRLLPNFWDTTMLAAVYARSLTEELDPPDLTPAEAESLNLVHDVGRLVSPDQYYRNDILAERLIRRVGFRESVLEKLPSLTRLLGLSGKPVEGLDDMSVPQRILHVADWLGKRGAQGLVTVDEIVEQSNKAMVVYEQNAGWPSVSAAMRALASGKNSFGEDLFRSEVEWLEQCDIDFDEIRQRVEQVSGSEENQMWVAQAMAAQTQ
jgi:hypothetical protein